MVAPPDLPDELLSSQSSDLFNGPSNINVISSSANNNTIIQSQALTSNSSGIATNLLQSHVSSSQINHAQLSQLIQNDKSSVPASPSNSTIGSPHPVRQQVQASGAASPIVQIQSVGNNVSAGTNIRVQPTGKNASTGLKPTRMPTATNFPASSASISVGVSVSATLPQGIITPTSPLVSSIKSS